MRSKFWFENVKGSDHTGDLDVEGRIILKWILKIQGVRVWAVFVWLRIGTSDGLLRIRY
jgi:hypothetical protein